MKKEKDEKKYEMITITKRGGEKIVIKNFDENGIKDSYIVELEKEKFLHPENFNVIPGK